MYKFKKDKPYLLQAARPFGESEELGLPPLEDPDGLGRTVKWVRLMKGPVLHYYGDEIELSEEYLALLVANTVKQNGPDYRTPLIRQHEPNGEREGELFTFLVHPEGDVFSLFTGVVFLDKPEEASEKIESGKWSSVSVGIWESQDSISGIWRCIIAELSLVSAPHINDAKILNTKGGKKMTADEIRALIAEGIAAALAKDGDEEEEEEEKVAAADDDGVAEDAEEEEDIVGLAAENVRLRAKIAASEVTANKAKFAKNYPIGNAIMITKENQALLFAIADSDHKAWNTAMKASVVAPKQSTQGIEAPNGWDTEVAGGDVPVNSGKILAGDVGALVKKHGRDHVLALIAAENKEG